MEATSTKKRATTAPSAPTSVEKTSHDAKRMPVKTIRVEDCSATIWDRVRMIQGEPKTFYSVTLERSYKDRDGSWKYTKTFDTESLGRVMSLCQQVGEFITNHQFQQQDAED